MLAPAGKFSAVFAVILRILAWDWRFPNFCGNKIAAPLKTKGEVAISVLRQVKIRR